MKLKRISIKNIGLVENSVIEVNTPLILFYGQIRQGKTTYLNAVKWACGAEFPDDIIRHGAKEASIELDFDGGLVSRSWYKNKEGKTTARGVVFVRNGKPVGNPSYELKRLMNPFLLNQDHLKEMGETDRKRFFAEQFSVDTTALDSEAFSAKRDAETLRAEIKGYGEIDLKEVARVDVAVLQGQLRQMRETYQNQKKELENQLSQQAEAYTKACAAIDTENEQVREHNAAVDRATTSKGDMEQAVEGHKKAIAELQAKIKTIVIEDKRLLKVKPPAPDRTAIQIKIADLEPDTAILEASISEAGAANARADQFEKDKARAAERDAKAVKLAGLEKRQREIKAEKIAKLKTVTDESGIAGLAFNEDGEFTYNGTAAGMLSTSEIMKLSSELSALAPEGIGIQLLDRGESLGESIFTYVEQAKRDEVTILATIVGTKPANVPEDIGVFVVENGKATK